MKVAVIFFAAIASVAFAAPEPKRDAVAAGVVQAPKDVTVEFTFRPERKESAAIREVTVVGDFNRWNAFMHPLNKGSDGVFRAKVRMPSGAHEWRFVINGSWVHDMSSLASRCTPVPQSYIAAQDGGRNAQSLFR